MADDSILVGALVARTWIPDCPKKLSQHPSTLPIQHCQRHGHPFCTSPRSLDPLRSRYTHNGRLEAAPTGGASAISTAASVPRGVHTRPGAAIRDGPEGDDGARGAERGHG
jgi:hypothetical protein